MNGDTPTWSWRSSSHRQKSNNMPSLTWTSLRALSSKKDKHEHNGSAKKHRRGSMETSSISTTRPWFAAPTTTSHCNEPACNGAARTNSSSDTEAVIMHRLEPIHSYLMLSTPNGAENSRRLDSHLESNNTPYSIGNLSIHKSSPHSSNYQVECMGEKFTGFHRVFFDDTNNASPSSTTTSFYKSEVSPLALEFVKKKRNICIIVHGTYGTGRRRILFGDSNNRHAPIHNESPYYRRQSDDYDDDVSSLGSQGVSEIQNSNAKLEHKLRPKVHIIPQEVRFESSSTFSLQNSSPEEQDFASPSKSVYDNDNNGIIPKLIDEICTKLRKYHPQSSFHFDSSGEMVGDIPRVIPPEQSSSKCILGNSTKQKTLQHRDSMGTCTTENAFVTPQKHHPFVGVRVSCFEIVDDLASGETTTHDLLSECAQTENWPTCVIEDETPPNLPQKKKSRRRTYDSSLKSSISWGDGELDNNSEHEEDVLVDFVKSDDNSSSSGASLSREIIHDSSSGITYVENSVEVRCFSRAAIMECLVKAEVAQRNRNDGDDEANVLLSHTVYLITVEHDDQTSPGKIALTRQIVISKIDESMSNSASLALHSSCSALNSVTRQLANYASAPPSRRNALTQLLTGCIGGNCRTFVLGTADPVNDDITLPTLRFGEAVSWVYNYWSGDVDNSIEGEDVSDTDSDEDQKVDVSAADTNGDCNSPPLDPLNKNKNEEQLTPSTEPSSSSDSKEMHQLNAIKGTKEQEKMDVDVKRHVSPGYPQRVSPEQSNPICNTEEDREQANDSSWRATINEIDESLDLVLAKMKCKPKKSDSGDNLSSSERIGAAIPQDHPSAGNYEVQLRTAKEDEVDKMRAEIEALRQERDILKKRQGEKEVELEKAREDIFLLKNQQREDISYADTVQWKPKQPVDQTLTENSEPIKVCLRVRPKSKLEAYRRSTICIEASEHSPDVRIDSTLHGTHHFSFDKVFGVDTSQRTVSDFFQEQFTSKLLNGVNCALILGGAKSSGKSHSLFGEIPAKHCPVLSQDAGILPNLILDLFQVMKIRSSTDTMSYTIKCSFVAIHLDRIIDLLRHKSNETETIFARYSPQGLRLDGATELHCFEEGDAIELIRRGRSFQSILSDTVSAENNFFHSCFILTVEASTGKRTTLSLFELFGFGSTQKSNTMGLDGNTPYRRSSAALYRVVDSLSHDAAAEVPYQLSKITSLLRNALGGNCSTTVMIHTSPCRTTSTETLGAIKLGLKLQKVNNFPNTSAPDSSKFDGGDKLNSMLFDSQSKLVLFKQKYDVLLKEKQAVENVLIEERQRMKSSDLDKEHIKLELKRMKLRVRRTTDFIKCLRGLIKEVKSDVDESRAVAIDHVIDMIDTDIDFSDLVDLDELLHEEGFISKDEMTHPSDVDVLLNKIYGSGDSGMTTDGEEKKNESSHSVVGGTTDDQKQAMDPSHQVRMLRRDLRKIAKTNVELQVSLKKEAEFVQNIVKGGEINTNKLANEAVAMRTSRDKMTNAALVAVNKLNEIKSTNKMLVKQATIIRKHNKCIEDSMNELEHKLKTAEGEVTRLEKARLSQTNELKVMAASILFNDMQTLETP